MSAKELLCKLDGSGQMWVEGATDAEEEAILRALRLLAVIESAEGETPETDAFVSVRFGQMVCSHAELRDLARRLERERNAALRALEGARDELANVRAQLADHIGHVSTPIK